MLRGCGFLGSRNVNAPRTFGMPARAQCALMQSKSDWRLATAWHPKILERRGGIRVQRNAWGVDDQG